ncbi:hypothetical protein HID58_068554 [Brassica napus]|uniref:Cellulose synthase n=1 Tax=Brassica napus TaxID=3708 RepID=A0ABQ7ZLP4_BRANA|nr:hypothetical protein HID58_068554 [Brassica napus]
MKLMSNSGEQTCQICSENVGRAENGDPFVACDVCSFSVCRPWYEYETKYGNQSCPQCKTIYKGSPAIPGDKDEDFFTGEDASEFSYTENSQKEKTPEGMLGWHLTHGKGKEVEHSVSDKEVPPNLNTRLISIQEVSGESSAASLEGQSVSSTISSGKRLTSPSRRIVDVAWKERVDVWKMKQENGFSPVRSQSASERGVYDFNATINDSVDEALLYDRAGEPSQLAAVDIFVSTVDPLKEPPLVTANTVLSIMAVDYPVDKVSCYVSDDGAAMLSFESLAETSEFARKWVPFCKKYSIEPRAPEWYFALKVDYLKDKVHPSFVKDRRAMKREYARFKIRINALVSKAEKVPREGWVVQDGQNGGLDAEGNELPRLVYVSREKRPGLRVSAVLTNGPFLLNLDCDHYINNSKALREAMCFLMDLDLGKQVCYVQFPQRFDGIDKNDRYANRNTVFFDINLRGFDGIQGPVYVGTGCVFNRTALYVNLGDIEEGVEAPALDDDKTLLMSQIRLEQRFGQSDIFVASTLMEHGGFPLYATPENLLKEAIHVISCGYEDTTEWGTEIGWIYGSVTEDILTGFKMHARGWRSIYCMPKLPAFKGSAPINLSDRLNQVLRWALGSIEILFSRHCPIWYGYGGRLKFLERFAYVNTTIYPITSIPLLMYCTLPAVCLFTNQFIIPEISNLASIWFLSLFLSIFATGVLEMRWSGVGRDEWWRNEQFWVIGGVSAHLFAVVQGLLKVLAGIDTNFTVTSKASDEDGDSAELYLIKWTTLLIPPTTLLIINLLGVVAGISYALNSGYQTWGPLFGKLLFAFWVIVHLYPFLKGLMGRQNRTPTVIVVWSVLLSSIFSLLWIRVDPFTSRFIGPDVKECGYNC